MGYRSRFDPFEDIILNQPVPFVPPAGPSRSSIVSGLGEDGPPDASPVRRVNFVPAPPATTNEEVPVVPTVQGIEVTAPPSNADKMRAILDAIYPTDAAPEMKYGTPLDIKIPFTKRRIKASGQTMDRLASAIAAAAQGMRVSPNDPGGQLLRGLVQGYGEARGADYATRKATYEKKKEEYQKNLEARRKLAGTLGIEQFKQEIKPEEVDNKTVVVTKQLILDARKAGKVIPDALIDQRVPIASLIGEVKEPGVNYEGLNFALRKADLGMRQANNFQQSKAYQNYQAALDMGRAVNDVYATNPGVQGDKQLVRILAKLQDANSAVMAGEEKNFTEATSFARKWQAWADGLTGKGKFTADDRATAIRLINLVLRTKRASFDEVRRNEQDNLRKSGIDPSYIGDLAQFPEIKAIPGAPDPTTDPNL